MPGNKRSRDDMDEGARKKLKHDRSEASPPRNIIDLSSDSAGPPGPSAGPSVVAQAVVPSRSDDESTKALRVLHADFDALRSLVTCKICERLLYEPYVLSCGHTYCYSCLCTWFQGKNKKTCPNCRDVIRHMPAPSYVIKEMTAVFIARTELLPDGETPEQHKLWRQEESDIVQIDKSNDDARTGGLFKGSFADHRHRIGPIFDREDNVERCPGCNWEIEGGVCSGCGYRPEDDFDDIGSGDEISDDVSDELDSDDVDEDDLDHADGDFGQPIVYDVGMYGRGPPENLYGLHQRHANGHARSTARGIHVESDEEDEEEEDDDEAHSLDGFIDDDHYDTFHGIRSDSGSEDAPSSSVQSAPRNRRPRRIISDDEDEDDEDEHVQAHDRSAATYDEVSDTESIPVPRRPAHTRRVAGPPITIVDSDDESLDSSSDVDIQSGGSAEDSGDGLASTQHSDDEDGSLEEHEAGGEYAFSPIQQSDDEGEPYGDGSDGEDGENFTWPGRANNFTVASTLHPPNSSTSMRTSFPRPAAQHLSSHIPNASRALHPNYPSHLSNSPDPRYDTGGFPASESSPPHCFPSSNYRRLRPVRDSSVFVTRNPSGRARLPVPQAQIETNQYSNSREANSGSGSEDASSSDTLRSLHEQPLQREGHAIHTSFESQRAQANNANPPLRPMTFNAILDRQRQQRITNAASLHLSNLSRQQNEDDEAVIHRRTSLARQGNTVAPRGARSSTSNTRAGPPSLGRAGRSGGYKSESHGNVVDLVSSGDDD